MYRALSVKLLPTAKAKQKRQHDMSDMMSYVVLKWCLACIRVHTAACLPKTGNASIKSKFCTIKTGL